MAGVLVGIDRTEADVVPRIDLEAQPGGQIHGRAQSGERADIQVLRVQIPAEGGTVRLTSTGSSRPREPGSATDSICRAVSVSFLAS